MLRVPGRGQCDEAQIPDDDLLRVLRDVELVRRDGQELAPERIHPLPVDARR